MADGDPVKRLRAWAAIDRERGHNGRAEDASKAIDLIERLQADVARAREEIASLTHAGTDLPDPRIPSRAWLDEEREAVASLKTDLASLRERLLALAEEWDGETDYGAEGGTFAAGVNKARSDCVIQLRTLVKK